MEIFRFTFSPIEVNTFVLSDQTGECAVIDCGCYNRKEFDKLSGYIEKNQLKPVLLLNTHCHLDHVFGNNFMLEKYHLRPLCHIEDEMNRKNAVNYALFFGLQMDQPPDPGGFLNDGQEISFGMTKLKALHVPGHAAGSLAFYSQEDKVVFTGDALFAGSIGRTDLPGGDYATLIRSITERLFSLPPETVVWPGHGGKTTIDTEIRSNPYFN